MICSQPNRVSYIYVILQMKSLCYVDLFRLKGTRDSQ